MPQYLVFVKSFIYSFSLVMKMNNI